MLVSFSVTNFRSIKERQTLSLISARKDHELEDNLLPAEATASIGVRLMRTAIIYGANASGKSNLLRAMLMLRQMVVFSATGLRPEQPTGAVPFILNTTTRQQPSEFEVVFLLDGVRYEYRVIVDAKVVHLEELICFPKGKAALVFLRTINEKPKFGSTWKGGSELVDKTRPNALLLSVGAQFNHPVLSPVYHWFATRLHYWDLSSADAHQHQISLTAVLVHENPEVKTAVEALLSHADLGITGVRTRAIKPDELRLPPVPDQFAEAIRGSAAQGKIIDTRFLHHVEGATEPVEMLLGDESIGTQRFFGLLGQLHQIIAAGACIVIDELDASLHPLLVRAVVAMLHDPLVNKNNAQAIVTTHDTTLLSQEVVRRDQVWFTEKDQEGGTRLYPLTDYKPKQGEALQRGYLGGRYGGVPILPARLGA
jgi:hypothetical protein